MVPRTNNSWSYLLWSPVVLISVSAQHHTCGTMAESGNILSRTHTTTSMSAGERVSARSFSTRHKRRVGERVPSLSAFRHVRHWWGKREVGNTFEAWGGAGETRGHPWGLGSVGGGVHSLPCMVVVKRASHPCNAGTEHVGYSPTRPTLISPSAKRRDFISYRYRLTTDDTLHASVWERTWNKYSYAYVYYRSTTAVEINFTSSPSSLSRTQPPATRTTVFAFDRFTASIIIPRISASVRFRLEATSSRRSPPAPLCPCRPPPCSGVTCSLLGDAAMLCSSNARCRLTG